MNPSDAADAGIADLYAAWADAFRRQDLEGIMSLLTPDYLLWAAGAPAMTRDSLSPRLAVALATYDITQVFEREECLVAGDFAFERGWDMQSVRPRAGGELQTQRQRVFLILQRERDGKWRFARGMSQPGPVI